MEANITRELIFEHFANKVTPLQRRQIDEWLQTEGNEELYYKWLEEWENSNPEYQPDSELLVEDYLKLYPHQPPSGRSGRRIVCGAAFQATQEVVDGFHGGSRCRPSGIGGTLA